MFLKSLQFEGIICCPQGGDLHKYYLNWFLAHILQKMITPFAPSSDEHTFALLVLNWRLLTGK